MDFVLVFPLILALISSGQCNPGMIVECDKKCPAGYHVPNDACPSGKRHCKQCEANTFTEIENISTRCLKCRECAGHSSEIETQRCSSSHNTVCSCKEGFYNAGSKDTLDCRKCNSQQKCENCANQDFKLKCCLRGQTATPAATSISTPVTTVARETPAESPAPDPTSSIASNSTPLIVPVPHNQEKQLWLSVVVLVVTFLLFILLLLLLNNNLCRTGFLCWRAKKDVDSLVENSILNEQPSQRGGSPTTLTWTFVEENPMMPLNQSPPASEPPALIYPLLPDSDHLAARQCDKSDHWPAIVLYAIIKEVPLRRWKEFLRLLNVADHQLERVELEAGFGLSSMERQYQMLRLWSQRPSACLNDVFSALHYMDLSGCAQLLQESLEKMQWQPEPQQAFTEHGSNGTVQHT
ncbi:tumor necrosis factor receptor superfamily member 1A [Parambassis ranga]|uniref:Tumor necrosis factor receptor superfamily member 1A n=1 Tax=Parambassis ranga TaxID=210632 RepID=A0A6P7IDS9_9TELE|nr:tumor necrosis factor receptor superfamily member 1A-like [Parambassis ranga]